MKAVVALLIALIPLVWIYLKHYAKKANSIVQANLHLERLDEKLKQRDWDGADREVFNLIMKTMRFSEVSEYFDRVKSTERNRRCLAYLELSQLLDELDKTPDEVLLKDADDFAITGGEIEHIVNQLWQKFDHEVLHLEILEAQLNFMRGFVKMFHHFAVQGHTTSARRVLFLGGDEFSPDALAARDALAKELEAMMCRHKAFQRIIEKELVEA